MVEPAFFAAAMPSSSFLSQTPPVNSAPHAPLASSMTLRRSGGRLSYFFWFIKVNSGDA